MKKILLLWLSLALPVFGQANQGELQLSVTDPSGLPVKASIRLQSEANHYASAIATNAMQTKNRESFMEGSPKLRVGFLAG